MNPEPPFVEQIQQDLVEARARYRQMMVLYQGFHELKFWEKAETNINPLSGPLSAPYGPGTESKKDCLNRFSGALDRFRRAVAALEAQVREVEDADRAETADVTEFGENVAEFINAEVECRGAIELTAASCEKWTKVHAIKVEDIKERQAGEATVFHMVSEAAKVHALPVGLGLGAASGPLFPVVAPIVTGAISVVGVGATVAGGIAGRLDRDTRGVFGSENAVAMSVVGHRDSKVEKAAGYFKKANYAITAGRKVLGEVADHVETVADATGTVAEHLFPGAGGVVSAHLRVGGKIAKGMEATDLDTTHGTPRDRALNAARMSHIIAGGASPATWFVAHTPAATVAGPGNALDRCLQSGQPATSGMERFRGYIDWITLPLFARDYTHTGGGSMEGTFVFHVPAKVRIETTGETVGMGAWVQLGLDGSGWVVDLFPNDTGWDSSPWRMGADLPPAAAVLVSRLRLAEDWQRYVWHHIDATTVGGRLLAPVDRDGLLEGSDSSFWVRRLDLFSQLPEGARSTIYALMSS